MPSELLQTLARECLEAIERKGLPERFEEFHVPTDGYRDPVRFDRERDRIHQALPMAVAHTSELPGDASFIVRQTAHGSVLLVRHGEGVSAFLNVCRHRGAAVASGTGCAKSFSCPYHGWSYGLDGRLLGVPQGRGFPTLDREKHALVPLQVEERHGFVWLLGTAGLSLDSHLDALGPELEALGLADHRIAQSGERTWHANWRLLMEGGLEAYHFRETHRDTVASYFMDNLCVGRRLGLGFLTLLPKRTFPALTDRPPGEWDVRQHVHLLFTMLPGTMLLVQSDHVVWISSLPLAPDRTRVALRTLVPLDSQRGDEFWAKQHAFTTQTLDEDFFMGEAIQQGLGSGANAELRFGGLEVLLAELNRMVDELIA